MRRSCSSKVTVQRPARCGVRALAATAISLLLVSLFATPTHAKAPSNWSVGQTSRPGDTVTLLGGGCGAIFGGTAEVVVGAGAHRIATSAPVDLLGGWAVSVKVPNEWPHGSYTVTTRCPHRGAVMTSTLTVSSAPSSPPTTTVLGGLGATLDTVLGGVGGVVGGVGGAVGGIGDTLGGPVGDTVGGLGGAVEDLGGALGSGAIVPPAALPQVPQGPSSSPNSPTSPNSPGGASPTAPASIPASAPASDPQGGIPLNPLDSGAPAAAAGPLGEPVDLAGAAAAAGSTFEELAARIGAEPIATALRLAAVDLGLPEETFLNLADPANPKSLHVATQTAARSALRDLLMGDRSTSASVWTHGWFRWFVLVSAVAAAALIWLRVRFVRRADGRWWISWSNSISAAQVASTGDGTAAADSGGADTVERASPGAPHVRSSGSEFTR